MQFWFDANGNLLSDASGNIFDCGECPCPSAGPVASCCTPPFTFLKALYARFMTR